MRHALAQTGPLKIALLLPTSGVQALIGQMCARATAIAADVLADSKVPVKVEITSYDTESSPDVSRTQAEKAIAAGAHVLIGAFDSGQTTVIAQVAEQKGVPFIVNIAAAPQITESGFKWVVRNFPTAPMLVTGALTLQKDLFAATGKTPKTAVLMSVNDTFGEAMMKAIPALAKRLEMPYEIVETISYDPRAKDLSAEVAKAKATKAELVMPVSRLNDAKLLIQEMVKQQYEPMGIVNPGAPGLYEPDFLKTMGKFANFHVSNVPWVNPKSAMSGALEKRYAEKFKDGQVDINVGFTFEAILVAADAYARAKSTAAAPMMEAIKATNIAEHVMTGGPIKFDEKGQNTGIKAAAVQNLNNKPTVVLPAEFAVAKPVFPMPGWRAKERG
ncbi:MAG: ABC transporter substrate-binding protein [Rhodospirillales bacterium]|nr:ABC transporter substrate-binding protein [Rhodospirillales bacterium]QQS14943.1 MAG: ABC transporter substrate-binding protein [Rhodospirillales bacterium]